MNTPASPAAASQLPRPRLVHLAAVAFTTLAIVSCSAPAPSKPAYVSAPGKVRVSAIESTPKTTTTDWCPESLPFSGDAREVFAEPGPDYFVDLLRNIPRVD